MANGLSWDCSAAMEATLARAASPINDVQNQLNSCQMFRRLRTTEMTRSGSRETEEGPR
jgi:hypothetical protein